MSAGLVLAAPFAHGQESTPPETERLEIEQASATGVVAVDDPEPYAARLDAALREGRDVWGEALIAGGGATYDAIKDYLRPLFYSTGHAYTEPGVHNLLWGDDGGDPPYIIPLADGSRIAANVYRSEDYLAWHVGPDGEAFGSDLARLEGPALAEGWLPVLQTAYTDRAGNRYAQESFAGRSPDGGGLLAWIRLRVEVADGENGAVLRARFGDDARERFRYAASPGVAPAEEGEGSLTWRMGPGEHTLYAVWSPEGQVSREIALSRADYARARDAMKLYWDGRLAPVLRFDVPEAIVMDAQRNLLIQNLIMRWRYSLGAVVYHGSFYQPESSDAVQLLGEFGHPEAYCDGLAALLDMTKGQDYYINWERGEKLTHGAHYYYLTRDADFIRAHTDAYVAICEAFRAQMEADPHGLLMKQRQCGDIPEVAYFIFHQTLGWQGMRDMAEVWRAIGREDLYETWRPVADRLKAAIDAGMRGAAQTLGDGSLFVPRALYLEEAAYPFITETKIGSYWNLVMPYAFASGYWPLDGPEAGRILDYMHGYGGLFLGLLRFNYYPTPIGAYRADGLPGYYTTGDDNVYLPSYLRVLAAQGEADRQVLSFYGKLAHGMTRNTFVAGEGSTIGARPGVDFRSCYGTPSSANNTAFLLNLRLMLVRESFNSDTGAPEGLFLAHATPREWLEDGKVIAVDGAPTCFGPVAYRIASHLAEGRVEARVTRPERNAASVVRLRLRLPAPYRMAAATAGGEAVAFDAETGTIDLSGFTGEVVIEARVENAGDVGAGG